MAAVDTAAPAAKAERVLLMVVPEVANTGIRLLRHSKAAAVVLVVAASVLAVVVALVAALSSWRLQATSLLMELS